MLDSPIQNFNRQGVGMQGDRVVVLNPIRTMTKREALVHAAWLVAIAEETPGEFVDILVAVQET